MKKVSVLLLLGLVVIAGFLFLRSKNQEIPTPQTQNSKKLVVPDNPLSDLIILENPQPNQKIQSPLSIKGSARGSWFFEAQASVELFDQNGESIGRAPITTEGEWMTDEFVPFTGSLQFSTESKTGKLVLSNGNPSGLEENKKELTIPVSF